MDNHKTTPAKIDHSAEGIARFRRDCVESLIGSTADNINDTGHAPSGVRLSEVIGYYIVRSSYSDDVQDVAQELEDMAELIADDHDNLSFDELEEACTWSEDDVKFEFVYILRSLSILKYGAWR